MSTDAGSDQTTLQEAGGWLTMAASLPGSKHREQQRGCEDALGYRLLPGSASLAIVVADGAGSAARGREGADTAVATLLAGLAAIDGDLESGALDAGDDAAVHARLGRLLLDGHTALLQRAHDLGCHVRDTSCTVAAALLRADLTLVAQVGDVGTTIVLPDGEMRLVIAPVKGEYANQTEFLSSWPPVGLDRSTAVVRDPVVAAIVHSDGLNEVFYDDPFGQMRPARRLLEKLLDGLRTSGPADDMDAQLEGFLLSPAVQARSNDDLSVVIACRTTIPTDVAAVDSPAAPEESDSHTRDAAAEPDVGQPESPTDDGPQAEAAGVAPVPGLPSSGPKRPGFLQRLRRNRP